MSSEFHWAFIGAGTLGAKVAKEITKSGRHKIASVYVRNAEKRAAFAKQYGALAAKTPEEAISAPGVDAVYIVTPHTTHYEYARLALELGKPVLCEKPVSTDAEKVRALIRLSREKGLYFAEAMWSWFSPVARKVKQWYEAGEYGDITRFSMNYHMKSINYAPRVSDPRLAGGALLDIGVYPLTYAWRLWGKPERVVCTGTLILHAHSTGATEYVRTPVVAAPLSGHKRLLPQQGYRNTDNPSRHKLRKTEHCAKHPLWYGRFIIGRHGKAFSNRKPS